MFEATALCHLHIIDDLNLFYNIWSLSKNELCAKCVGWNTTNAVGKTLVHTMNIF